MSAPITPPYDLHGRRRSSSALPACESTDKPEHSTPVILSPPPTPRTSRTLYTSHSLSRRKDAAARISHRRLRSGSGLMEHTNEDALREYTDYNTDGSPRSPLFQTVNWRPVGPAAAGAAAGPGEIMKVGFRHSGSTTGSGTTASLAAEEDGAAAAAAADWADFPEFLGNKAFERALADAKVSRRLYKFAQRMGCGENVAFLLKVREYAATLSQLTAEVSVISNNFTSVTARGRVQLPCRLASSLDTDLKHVSSSILPGLESLFNEPRACVERRVSRDVYPAFVMSQLTLLMTACLSSDLPLRRAGYPGLGTGFCVTEGNLYEYASDDFAALTGYSRERIIHQNGRILQGPLTDLPAVSRLLDQLVKQEEILDLLVNHREDGTPFWNLVYVCPLGGGPAGETRRYLHAYIDVSEGLRNSSDVLRVLGYEPASAESNAADKSSEKDTAPPRGGKSRKAFFKAFRKAPEEDSPSYSSTFRRLSSQRPKGHTPNSSTGSSSMLERPLPPLPPLDEREDVVGLQTVYRRFILLRHEPGPKAVRLTISFASRGALDLLNLGLAADAIRGQDIFDVLADHAHCPAVTKSLRASVRESVVGEGRHKAIELFVQAPVSSRKGSVAGWGEENEGRGSKAGRPKLVQLNTFWTPLKDRKGKPVKTVLVLIPTVGSGIY